MFVLGISLSLVGCGNVKTEDTYREIEPIEAYEDETEENTGDIQESSDNQEDADVQKPINSQNTDDADVEFTEEKTVNAMNYDELIEYSSADIANAASIQKGRYAYETLSPEDRYVYNQMYIAVNDMSKGSKIDNFNPDEINRIFQCVMMDHPEFFWVDGYTYTSFAKGDEVDAVGFAGRYTMDDAERDTRQIAIDEYVSLCMSGMPSGDDYSKIKYIYEYIIANTEYDETAPDNQNICSVFIGGRSVCQGYAKATQYLLWEAGIKSVLVGGTVKEGELHSWNLVLSDGDYYYVDTTWGDASYKMEGDENVRTPSINYDYLCVPDSDICKTHVISSVVTLPVCNSLVDNYYVREGAYFTGVNTEQLAYLFSKAKNSGKEFVTVKCSDENVYKDMREYLLEKQKIFELLPQESGKISYWEENISNSISFWL